jgi:hypothetical protein
MYTSVFVYTTASVTSATPRPDTALLVPHWQERLIRPLVLIRAIKFSVAGAVRALIRAALAMVPSFCGKPELKFCHWQKASDADGAYRPSQW